MDIVIENTVCLNTGDAAILLAIRRIAQEAFGNGIRFYVFDTDPDVVCRLYPRQSYPDMEFRQLLSETVMRYNYRGGLKDRIKPTYNRLVLAALKRGNTTLLSADERQSVEIYRNADMVITTGGTYLVENYNLQKRFNQFRIDMALGKQPIFFTQSLGPFNKAENRAAMQPVLAASPLVLLRDERSRDHILDLVDDQGKAHVVADSVFALADTDRIRSLATSAPATTGRVAISVRRWAYVQGGDAGMDGYMESIRALTTRLVRDHGKRVVFLSTCQGVPEYRHDDSKTARAIVDMLDADVASEVSVDAGFHTPEQLMAAVRDMDFVVATRMHMMILSLCVGTPVLPIAYEFKTLELAKRLGIADLALDIDSITPEDALVKLDAFLGRLGSYRTETMERVLDENRSAMSAVALLQQMGDGLARMAA